MKNISKGDIVIYIKNGFKAKVISRFNRDVLIEFLDTKDVFIACISELKLWTPNSSTNITKKS